MNVFKKKCEVTACDDELIIYNSETEMIMVLNKSAKLLWENMIEAEALDCLAKRYYGMFDPAPPQNQFKIDFEKIIAYFEECGIIEIK